MAHVEIYSSMLCPFCYRAKKLLDSKGIAYDETDVLMHPSKRAEMVERAQGRTSVPQIFINGQHVGGSDELHALDAQGELDPLLEAVT
ncbi:MAG: glutaredoxin 3 [Kiloniellales bacterium]|nr:glutaredoxin 3 [Kiloniellales bacterium]